MHNALCESRRGPDNIGDMAKHPKAKVYFKAWRKHAGLNQERAADRMGIEQGTLSRLEREAIRFTPESLAAMAHAYGCEVGDLFRPPGRSKAELEKVLESLDEHLHAQAVRIVKALAADKAA